MIDHLAVFIYFFAVVDPIGTVPVFLAVTSHYPDRERRRIALFAFLASTLILLFFIVAGELILSAMKIPLEAFQVAGGIILFLFALSMIFGESKPDQEVKLATRGQETAIFPLAVPSIASPGAILAAVLLTENARYDLWQQTQTALMLFAVLVITLVLMLAAGWIHRVIGSGGASLISRVMGLILASVATANTLAGIKAYFA